MIKLFLTEFVRGEILLTGVFFCLLALPALAQNASPVTQVTPGTTASANHAAGIGPAPTNSKQHQILTGALSPQTRQTLQEAMDSARTAATAYPAPPAK